MNNSIILKAESIKKSFSLGGQKVEVLQGVSLEMRQEESIAIMGASGSGKSTLLHLLGLLDTIDSGRLSLDGQEVHNLGQSASSRIRALKIGFVFQQFQLLPELNALENVLMPRRLIPTSWWKRKEQEKKRAKNLLAKVGLENRFHHKPNQLSGGEQQRVAIARALISNPKILLADEPTGNLDSRTGQETLNLLIELASHEKSTVLLATHDQNIAEQCSRTLTLEEGKLISKESDFD